MRKIPLEMGHVSVKRIFQSAVNERKSKETTVEEGRVENGSMVESNGNT